MPDEPAVAIELQRVLDVVRENISYLRATTEEVTTVVPGTAVTDDGSFIACDELIADGDWLGTVIARTGQQIGTEDPMVAASLFVQSYSYRVLTLAIACATTCGVVPDSSAASMAIGLKGGRVSQIAYTRPAILVLDASGESIATTLASPTKLESLFAYIDEHAIDEHLALLIDATRSRIRVGERLLWGNVAASMAVAFRTMEGTLGSWVQDVGTYFVDHAPTPLQGLGSFLTVENEGRSGWFWERTNCCLYDRLPGDIRCSDCSRTAKDVRRSAYRTSLEGS